MPIVALGESTIRAIGSASALPDPSSVAKELLDNALDAGATSIFVEISVNTLDIIQVKDNGSGIQPADRSLVCKQNYTSKIQTKEDLNNINGKSLGFRGQALASIAEMSDAVYITTRVIDEQAARIIKFGRDGKPISDTLASHPVGTTVRVIGFLKSLPVRRQEAEKKSAKSAFNIKKLLQRYAIARPKTRFSLRLLKSKDNDWVYAPSSEASVRDAISQVISPTVMTSCISRNLSYPIHEERNSPDTEEEVHDVCTIHISIIIPNPSAECLSNVDYKGQYVVIDGRPILTSKGFGKEISRRFKARLKQAIDESNVIADPFMFLSLDCPPGIYDINIEPSKDDVLFEDHQVILQIIETAFMDVYCLGASTNSHLMDTHRNIPNKNDEQASLSTGVSSPALFKGSRCLPTDIASTHTTNPWKLSLSARQLRDPGSHLLTPGRGPQLSTNSLPSDSPCYRITHNRNPMKQTTLRPDGYNKSLTLTKQKPEAVSNGSFPRAIPTQEYRIDVPHTIGSFLHAPVRNITRGNEEIHLLRPYPHTAPCSKISFVAKSPQSFKISVSNSFEEATLSVGHSILRHAPHNHRIDYGSPGYIQVPPTYKSVVPADISLRISSPDLTSDSQRPSTNRYNNSDGRPVYGGENGMNNISGQGSQSPMECTPSVDSVYEETIYCRHGIQEFSDSIKLMVDTDHYVRSGTIEATFSQADSTSSLSYWASRLRVLAKQPSFQYRLSRIQLSLLSSPMPSG
ncbi:hypothetical protein MaudCBS49596_002883 [Microsporum audouinii]